ncbi:MAG: SpoIIE family protein phosphatase [Clostridiaceae bacterium]|nr:SpoIIE family protein phosphatase [Clostridiaceae bacterium]
MFQNIARDFEENQNSYEDVELNKSNKIKEILKKCFTKKMVILYVLSFLLSCVSFGPNSGFAPFGIAILVAILSNCTPIGIVSVLVLTGTSICFGGTGALNVLLTLLFVFISILIKSPKYVEGNNEKRKLGTRLFISCLIVQLIGLFFKEVIVYDIISSLVYSMSVFIFYKIFVNSICLIENIGERRAYSIEEVMGASLAVAISVCAIGNFNIFGFSVRNILCILIVLIMGWKNGLLVGATAGVTIGSVVGIIGGGEPVMIATYALSGMVAGIFNKLGKIGVIIGFVLGNVLLSYVSNGNTSSIIVFQEILIASLGLLAIPKNIKIDIEDLYGTTKLLSDGSSRTLEDNKDTIYKLNSMSETISEIARTYKEAAATIVDEEELKKQEQDNFTIFEKELQNDIDGIEENILFDDIYSPEDNLLEDIFDILLEKEKINRRELLDVLAKHNNYIIGYDREYINDEVEQDISQMLKMINYSYKVSKLNFIWKKKLDENKKAVSNQLEEVSKAIGALAEEIEIPEQDEFEKEKEEIKVLLQEKEVKIENIVIKKESSGRKRITLYTNICENVEKPACDIKKMTRILNKVCNENMILQKQECGLRLKKTVCAYIFLSEDKQTVQIGIAKSTKDGSTISGDTTIQTKLEDGKYLLAISDGMGSGKDAKKASKTAITMLEKLLSSGFEKDSSLRLINSTLNTIGQEKEIYATLDMAVLDLYAGNLEFIKNGACPTFVKNKRNVQVLKSLSLPSGILNDIDLVVYDKDLQENDILIMCSDGILDSSEEYTNRELWIKFLLEEIETDDVQKIADIILQEAIDNNYGIPKDDMSVIVARIKNK